jgi:histidinol-phosphate aminotransferase
MRKLLRENIRQLVPYASARSEYKGEAKIFLDANENPNDNKVNRYPDPNQTKLKKRIAQLKEISPEKIFLGNGSDEVIDLLFRAYCNPGIDNVITLPPTYGMYRVLASLNNIENRRIALQENFQLDLQGIFSACDQNTKMVFICSPNNPTGNCINLNDIKELLNIQDLMVVIDEAYIDFSDQSSCISLLEEYSNLVICQTLSKAYGMAGIRVGMCYASEEIISVLNTIKPPYNINNLSQEKALLLLEEKHYVTQVTETIRERKKLKAALRQYDFIESIYPSEANFLLVKCKEANTIYKFLLSQGIIVRNRSSQYGCENCLRITIGTEQENKILIEALHKFQ